MRLISILLYIALAIGSVGMVAGSFFGIAKFFNLGVFVAGMGFALGGIDSLVTRRMVFRASDEAYENYAGTPAIIVGLMVLTVGAAMVWSAYLLDNEQWHSTWNQLLRRPAPLLAVAGLFLVGFGVLMMLNPMGRHSWAWRILIYFPRIVLGIVVVAAGLAIVGLGAWEWREPQGYQGFVKTVPKRIDQLRTSF